MKISFNFGRNYGEGTSDNWMTIGEKTLEIHVYKILDFSKPFAENPNPKFNLPSKEVINMALSCVIGAKTEELASAKLTDGMY